MVAMVAQAHEPCRALRRPSGILGSVDQLGRVGGALVVMLGLLLLALSVAVVIGGGEADDAGWVVAIAISGIACVLMGGMGFRMAHQERVVQHMSLAALRSLVQTQPLGFSVCARCHVVMPGNLLASCHECGSTMDCVAVTTEDERKTALAAIPSGR
jgi:peptidoglycan/LPS O-acetylase OafA/YrhL